MNLVERVVVGPTVTEETFRAKFLEQTQITKSLAKMGEENTYELDSGRQIRSGYMGLVVRISNLLINKGESEPSQNESSSNDENQDTSSDKCQRTIADYLANKENAEVWQAWVEGGLKQSNEINNRKLGANYKADLVLDEDDSDSYPEENDKDFEKTSKLVQFSQIINSLKASNSGQDEEEEEEDEESEEKDEDDGDQLEGI